MSTASRAKKTPSLKLLTTRLKEIQRTLNDIYNYVENFPEQFTVCQVEVRLEKLNEVWEGFGEVLIEIQSHDDYDSGEETTLDKERQQFRDRYYKVKAFLMEKVKQCQPTLEMDQSVRIVDTSTHGTLDHVRLPQINLPTYNGAIDGWLSFRDLFTSLIHSKPDLPAVEKFHYLKASLQGEPKNLVDGLQITDANYAIAWDALLKRYDNSKLLKKRQIQSLFNLPTLSKESVTELHSLLETFEKTVQTLDQIVRSTDYKDLLLINLLSARLDPVTRRSWEEFASSKPKETLADLVEFLHRRIRVLESLPTNSTDTKVNQQHAAPKMKPPIRMSYNTVQTPYLRCVACKENHLLYQCAAFQRLSVGDRDALLKSNSLCRNCFRTGHQAKDCRSQYSCRNCKGRHHTMVCFQWNLENVAKVATVARGNSPPPPSPTDTPEATDSSPLQVANSAATNVLVSGMIHRNTPKVLLATAVVLVEDDEGMQHPARALLDSGSESNFISERLSQRMKVTRTKVDISVIGIGQAGKKVRQKINAVLRSRVSQFSRDTSFLVLSRVTANLPTTSFNVEGWQIPNAIELADPAFFETGAVDIVLGVESFFEFFQTGRRISLGQQFPSLNESVFGWVVCGSFTEARHPVHITCNASALTTLESLVERFWSIEEVESTRACSLEEKRCEEIFQNSFRRAPDGRYSVPLPKRDAESHRLGESWEIAFRRLQSTERRLARDVVLQEQYTSFMDEYLRLGHMTKVESTNSNAKRCFLPHHPVVKEASTTTKVRVVFDASCKTNSGVSLNDMLLAGPVIQDDLRSIIIRCRTKQILLVSDVEKMFRQVDIHPEDRPLQSILWRSSPGEEVNVFELNTVTYGTKPAPFLATRALQQLALDEEVCFPLAAKAVLEDTYMDDVITGAEDAVSAYNLHIQLDQLMRKGGFRLRKWASNSPGVLAGVSEENLAVPGMKEINLDPDPTVKTLGLVWMPNTDIFRFNFTIPPLDCATPFTKRQILSVVASLFDPLGLLGAVITSAKIFLQTLWTLRNEYDKALDWDELLPSTVGESWRRFHEGLPLLNGVQINRCVIIPGAIAMELHCFSDASMKASGAVIYLRSLASDGKVMVRLLTSKSKVAPLKCQTIPRLELCGAVLSAQLYAKEQSAIKISMQVYFWTDSTCVLRWIQAPPSTWSIFVANRVSKIQTLTEHCQWRHVPGTENPADLISRGISPEGIIENDLWWHGPKWLQENQDNWPQHSEYLSGEEAEQETRRTAVAVSASTCAEFNQWYLEKFSSFSNLVRCTAYWFRLMKLLQTVAAEKPKIKMKPISTAELKEAETCLIRLVQKETFSEEWKALSQGGSASRRSALRWFNPYIAEDGVIRVGGRLSHSNESEGSKHPVVLPARHRFTRLLLEYYHQRLLHAGPQLMLASIRLKYWPLGGRSVAKQVVHRCLRCFRSKPSPVQQFMGELPAPRITVSRPFSRTGVDYFGPLYVRPAPRRSAEKAYVAVFICLCTKAVHLELATDLSTECFLKALRRFISRRDRCSDIYSDNGTNFVGARNKLLELLQLLKDKEHYSCVARECAKEGIQWHFSPPSGPHFGGLWEAAVRSAKFHILKVMGEEPMSPEDLTTLLVQVEGCLNSRPITQLSNDPNDLQPLTPAHFLIGTSLHALPELDLEGIPINRLQRWQLIQRKLQDFWKRWRREYLCQLQGRFKRWKPPVSIEVGRLAIICEENIQPTRWRMGRIEAIHPGSDGVVRVVTLRTATGTLKRPVEKLCLLPAPESIDD